MTTKKTTGGTMREMLNARNGAMSDIARAQDAKRQVEDEIIIHLLRGNDHRFLTVNWRKLEREAFTKRG